MAQGDAIGFLFLSPELRGSSRCRCRHGVWRGHRKHVDARRHRRFLPDALELLPVPFCAQQMTHLPLYHPETPLDTSPLQLDAARRRAAGTAPLWDPLLCFELIRGRISRRPAHTPATPTTCWSSSRSCSSDTSPRVPVEPSYSLSPPRPSL